MKYNVKVASKYYEVEIEDIYARPVIARVDGQEFEVSLENKSRPTVRKEATEFKPAELPKQLQTSTSGTSANELMAPLPGIVIEILVKAGEQVEVGQVILIIEAMKMKNSVRSIRAGKIAGVLVATGETVAHKQALVKFAD